MRYRKLDGLGDMTFGDGQSNIWRDVPQAPAQAVQTRLQLWAGEWYIDASEGTPYQGGVLGMHTQATADPIIRQRILEAQGVTAILDYESIRDNESRVTRIEATIDTAYGEVAVIGVL